jgi:transposase
MVRITLSGETRQALVGRLQQADATHAPRLIRRIHALLWLGDGKSVWEIGHVFGIGEQTVRDWLHAFVLRGVTSLVYRLRGGRPAKLTRAQRAELRQCLINGPEPADYQSACWTAGIVADLIHRRFQVTYAPRDVCHLLDALGLSYQTIMRGAHNAR